LRCSMICTGLRPSTTVTSRNIEQRVSGSLVERRGLLSVDAGHFYAILLAGLFAIAAGLVGSVALMKRMVLASDVMSHLALPGLGIAYLLKGNPLVGGGATLFLGTLLVWQLQEKTELATDAS